MVVCHVRVVCPKVSTAPGAFVQVQDTQGLEELICGSRKLAEHKEIEDMLGLASGQRRCSLMFDVYVDVFGGSRYLF